MLRTKKWLVFGINLSFSNKFVYTFKDFFSLNNLKGAKLQCTLQSLILVKLHEKSEKWHNMRAYEIYFRFHRVNRGLLFRFILAKINGDHIL